MDLQDKNKHNWLGIVVLIMAISFLALFIHQKFIYQQNQEIDLANQKQATALINGQIINLEIANTPESRRQGLSDREELPENHGMLFVFSQKELQHFWMNRMNFPLDVLWIDDNTVVGLQKNIPTPTGDVIPIFESTEPVNYVLELNAGAIDQYGISEGDVIEFNL